MSYPLYIETMLKSEILSDYQTFLYRDRKLIIQQYTSFKPDNVHLLLDRMCCTPFQGQRSRSHRSFKILGVVLVILLIGILLIIEHVEG